MQEMWSSNMNDQWVLRYLPEAKKDMEELDRSVRARVVRAIDKVLTNPLPRRQGGYGDPLSNQNDAQLAGLCKAKLRKDGIRIVYKAVEQNGEMIVIVVGARADNEVYREAAKRRNAHGL